MRAPSVHATIERRLLVNYRIDPGVASTALPPPFRPAIVDGWAVAGVCLIRLGGIRLAGMPPAVGLTAENAAHRIAVEAEPGDGSSGVYIPRRDTSSRAVAFLGGRVFPGWHHRARFDVEERAGSGSYRVEMASADGLVHVSVAATVADRVMPGSVFATVEQASRFFRGAPVGYAATPTAGTFDGVELGVDGWHLEPLRVEHLASSYFEDSERFPEGSAILDSAFLMRGLRSTWAPRPTLVAAAR